MQVSSTYKNLPFIKGNICGTTAVDVKKKKKKKKEHFDIIQVVLLCPPVPKSDSLMFKKKF